MNLQVTPLTQIPSKCTNFSNHFLLLQVTHASVTLVPFSTAVILNLWVETPLGSVQ